MSIELILVIVVVLMLFGGGGYWGRGSRLLVRECAAGGMAVDRERDV